MPVDLPFTAGGEWRLPNQCAGMGIMGESGNGLEPDATAIISEFLEARGQSWVVVPFTLFDDGTVRSIGCRCFRFQWRASRLFCLGRCGGGVATGQRLLLLNLSFKDLSMQLAINVSSIMNKN